MTQNYLIQFTITKKGHSAYTDKPDHLHNNFSWWDKRRIKRK